MIRLKLIVDCSDECEDTGEYDDSDHDFPTGGYPPHDKGDF